MSTQNQSPSMKEFAVYLRQLILQVFPEYANYAPPIKFQDE